ncbi:hypothetical protein ACLB2K_007539 [Fragaria x ananassa]
MSQSFHSIAFLCLSFLIFQLTDLQHLALAWSWGPDVPPTKGFVSLPFNRSYYHIQKPYDVPEDQRCCFIDGVHKCWVYSTDKPHTTTSQTLPRTEIAIQGYGYSYGTVCGNLKHMRMAPVLVPNIYDKWFKINVVHDVDAAKVRVYIDGCLKTEANGRGGTSHAFKYGVYAQMNDSCYMECRWKDIKIVKNRGMV